MIVISPIHDMQNDLRAVLRTKGQRLTAFDYYGVVCTSSQKFPDDVIKHCNYIADMLKCNRYVTQQIDPGTWQPGAMRYLIYLIK